ncbi:UNVERIFIED_CONTAM: hypothetical protein Sradi_0134200 [Sesamum radiatum]|uniref:Uncharacterized protein n=1 Tax=Sesamum radiatum TaxID=300843 RepID=A0AAW2WKA0_SESRA
MPLAPKATASSNRTLGRTWSHKDLSVLHDGYSSHSSALTDDESKGSRLRNNGFEKIIRAVHAQKKAMARNQTALVSCLESDKSESFQDFPRTNKNYSTELGLLEKRKEDHRAQCCVRNNEDGESQKWSKSILIQGLQLQQEPSRARKRSSDKHRMSKRLTEEAEKYFEDFISNVEDTDISSFDGERSDGSSTLGGTMKPRDSTVRMVEAYKSPTGSTSCPAEMDGIILPWLQWETDTDGSLSANTKTRTKTRTPITPKSLQWDLEKGKL